MRLSRCAVLAVALLAPPCWGHGLFDAQVPERLPLIITAVGMALAWGAWLHGARQVRPRIGEALGFQAAMLLAIYAVFGPLDDLAETSASTHMTQHMLFIVVIAPLWVFARPLPQWRAAFGARLRPIWSLLLRSTRYPTLQALLHGAVIWAWHTPALYRLALDNPWWHAVEHACFLLSAWLFWWSVLRAGRCRAPQALMAVLLTMMHTGLLGALLAFASTSLYSPERELADQQLAGLIMWVPGSLFYLAGAGWVAWRWLSSSTARSAASR